jgi:hypothetical protein
MRETTFRPTCIRACKVLFRIPMLHPVWPRQNNDDQRLQLPGFGILLIPISRDSLAGGKGGDPPIAIPKATQTENIAVIHACPSSDSNQRNKWSSDRNCLGTWPLWWAYFALKYMVPGLRFVYRSLTHTTSPTCSVSSNWSDTYAPNFRSLCLTFRN